MIIFSVAFRFTPADDFDAVTSYGEVKIISDTSASARETFRATHSVPGGVYKIDSVTRSVSPF